MLVLDSFYFIFTPDRKAVEWCHSPHSLCESFCFSSPSLETSSKTCFVAWFIVEPLDTSLCGRGQPPNTVPVHKDTKPGSSQATPLTALR